MKSTASLLESEQLARKYFEDRLWHDGAVCPHCGTVRNATRLEARLGGMRNGEELSFRSHARSGTWQCNACRRQFAVTVGTIFERSRIPLHKWLMAIHLMCSTKEGVSALQIQRSLWGEDETTGKAKGSYRTAWFLCRRIRWAAMQPPLAEALAVETRPSARMAPDEREAFRPRERIRMPFTMERALELLLNVKPSGDMPRPGRNRQRSVWAEVHEDTGARRAASRRRPLTRLE